MEMLERELFVLLLLLHSTATTTYRVGLSSPFGHSVVPVCGEDVWEYNELTS